MTVKRAVFRDVINLTQNYVRAGEFLLGPGMTIYRIPAAFVTPEVWAEARREDPKVAVVDTGKEENVPILILDLDSDGEGG
jgi:hypothetical protein